MSEQEREITQIRVWSEDRDEFNKIKDELGFNSWGMFRQLLLMWKQRTTEALDINKPEANNNEH